MNFDARRRTTLAFIGTALSMPALAVAAAADGDGFLDLMPEFWAAYDGHRDEDVAARSDRLVDGFFGKHEDVYRQAGVKVRTKDVAQWLPGFDGRAAGARVVHERFAHDYAGNLGRFRAQLADFDGRASPVTLLPSLMHFDAHLQPDGPRLPLFFGPDAIVYFHGADADLSVLFSHELFHCYQGQKNPSMCLDPAAPLYVSLWMEGTATYASERLNPGASPLQVLLDDPALLHADASALRAASRGMLAHLDAADDATQSLFFQAGHHGEGWPPRAGYAVGLQIARSLGATMSLPQMAACPSARVRELLAQALGRVADGRAA